MMKKIFTYSLLALSLALFTTTGGDVVRADDVKVEKCSITIDANKHNGKGNNFAVGTGECNFVYGLYTPNGEFVITYPGTRTVKNGEVVRISDYTGQYDLYVTTIPKKQSSSQPKSEPKPQPKPEPKPTPAPKKVEQKKSSTSTKTTTSSNKSSSTKKSTSTNKSTTSKSTTSNKVTSKSSATAKPAAKTTVTKKETKAKVDNKAVVKDKKNRNKK
mgnify:CR=1 FL=1